MTPLVPWYITLVILAASIAIAAAVWRLLLAGVAESGASPAAAARLRTGFGAFLFGWLGLVLVLAPAPASLLSRDGFSLTPLIPIFSVSAAAALGLALAVSPAVRRAVGSMPIAAVHGVQLYRVIGATFLVLMAEGQVPAHFALPAGWGDIAVGVTAPLVALALARRVPAAPALAIAWNLLGLLDLGVAVGMGTGYLASALAPSVGGPVPAVGAMGVFPMILVPAFAVPVSVMLHVIGLVRVAGEGRTGSRLVPTLSH